MTVYMEGELIKSGLLRLISVLLIMVVVSSGCPVVDNHCFCHYVDNLQYINCSNMGLRPQIPPFHISYLETELMQVYRNTVVTRLQNQAFAYVKAWSLILRNLSITVVDHLAFSGLEQIIVGIDLGENNISYVAYDTFFRLIRLKALKLDGNRIVALEQSTFRGMSQLRYLNLAKNLLHELPFLLFQDLINLKILDLQGNGAASVPESLLASLNNLEELDLSDNRLMTIQRRTFSPLSNLRHLSLSGNNFSGVWMPAYLSHLINLTKLNMSHNHISAVSVDAFHGCQQLFDIDLSSNRLTNIHPVSLSSITSLQVLDLSDNSLRILVPSTFRPLDNLRLLRLNRNILHSLPAETFISNNNLELLDLSSNLIEQIPDDLFDANSSLVILNVSDNALSVIGGSLLNSSRLQRLDLSRNFISSSSLLVCLNLVNLVHLDIRYNLLGGKLDGRVLSLPMLNELLVDGNNVARVEAERRSTRLARLTLSYNSLTELPRLLDAPALTLLDLNHNYITTVAEDSFACCRNLRRLRLASNHIISLSVGAFRGMATLTDVDLSHNMLSYLSAEQFSSCSAMSTLNLSHNHFSKIDIGMLTGPTNLRHLDISWNRLTTLSSAHHVAVAFVRLLVSGNPLICDCQLTWLIDYLDVVDYNTTICCPVNQLRPAVCRRVVCMSMATCATATDEGSISLPVNRIKSHSARLCSQPVSLSLIKLLFQQQATTSSSLTSIHTIRATSAVVDTTSSMLEQNSIARGGNMHRYMVITVVVVPILGSALTFSIIILACLVARRRPIHVDWSDAKNCLATAVTWTVSANCNTTHDVFISPVDTANSSCPQDTDAAVAVTPLDDDSVVNSQF